MKEKTNRGLHEAGRGWTTLIWFRRALVSTVMNLVGSINLGGISSTTAEDMLADQEAPCPSIL
jgi:hypothetical protein